MEEAQVINLRNWVSNPINAMRLSEKSYLHANMITDIAIKDSYKDRAQLDLINQVDFIKRMKGVPNGYNSEG